MQWLASSPSIRVLSSDPHELHSEKTWNNFKHCGDSNAKVAPGLPNLDSSLPPLHPPNPAISDLSSSPSPFLPRFASCQAIPNLACLAPPLSTSTRRPTSTDRSDPMPCAPCAPCSPNWTPTPYYSKYLATLSNHPHSSSRSSPASIRSYLPNSFLSKSALSHPSNPSNHSNRSNPSNYCLSESQWHRRCQKRPVATTKHLSMGTSNHPTQSPIF